MSMDSPIGFSQQNNSATSNMRPPVSYDYFGLTAVLHGGFYCISVFLCKRLSSKATWLRSISTGFSFISEIAWHKMFLSTENKENQSREPTIELLKPNISWKSGRDPEAMDMTNDSITGPSLSLNMDQSALAANGLQHEKMYTDILKPSVGLSASFRVSQDTRGTEGMQDVERLTAKTPLPPEWVFCLALKRLVPGPTESSNSACI